MKYIEPERVPTIDPPAAEIYTIQLGAYKVREYAEAELKRVKAAGFGDAYIVAKEAKQ